MGKLNLWDVFEKLTGGFSSLQNGNDGANNRNADPDSGANGQKSIYGANSDNVFGEQKNTYDNGKNGDLQYQTSGNTQNADNDKQNLNNSAQNLNNNAQNSRRVDKNAKTFTFDLLKKHNEASARIDERVKNK